MRKLLLVLPFALAPWPALAHVGHLGELDGHAHYVAAWALFGVIAGALWLIWTEPKDKPRRPARPAPRARDPRA